MKKTYLAVVAIVGLAAGSCASAAGTGWYVLGGAGDELGTSGDKAALDNALTSEGAHGFSESISNPAIYRLQAGYQINSNWAIEGGYLYSNDESYSASGGSLRSAVDALAIGSGWTLTGVGILPLGNQFSLLGKLGVADIHDKAKITGALGAFSASGSKTAATYGIAAKYDFTDAVSARLDLDSYDVGDSSSSARSSVWTVNLGYKF